MGRPISNKYKKVHAYIKKVNISREIGHSFIHFDRLIRWKILKRRNWKIGSNFPRRRLSKRDKKAQRTSKNGNFQSGSPILKKDPKEEKKGDQF